MAIKMVGEHTRKIGYNEFKSNISDHFEKLYCDIDGDCFVLSRNSVLGDAADDYFMTYFFKNAINTAIITYSLTDRFFPVSLAEISVNITNKE